MTPSFPPDIKTPAYVLDVAALKKNMALAAKVRAQSGCQMLLATKAFAMPAAFPFIRDVLDGTTASGLYEARLGYEEFGKDVHVYAPAYAPGEVEALLPYANHIYFNAPEQLARFLPLTKASHKKIGLRVNPGYSKAMLGGALYDPCAPCSRFGTPQSQLHEVPWDAIDILHVHALCEARHDGSVGLMAHVAEHFGDIIRRVKAVNFGGGHFINHPDYDVAALIKAVKDFRNTFGVDVILEPGAGLVYNAGYLVSSVLALHKNDKDIALLDSSASTHMPDVLEVPYTPPVLGAAEPGVHPHSYILGGKTCMTGDIIGEYSFPAPLQIGEKIVFGDMMQYSFVKNNTFNGTPLPDIALLHENGRYEVIRSYGYEDFRQRLG